MSLAHATTTIVLTIFAAAALMIYHTPTIYGRSRYWYYIPYMLMGAIFILLVKY